MCGPAKSDYIIVNGMVFSKYLCSVHFNFGGYCINDKHTSSPYFL